MRVPPQHTSLSGGVARPIGEPNTTHHSASAVSAHWEGRKVSAGTYNSGCRCEGCTTANREQHRRFHADRSRREPPQHGLSGYTNWRCRCEVCKAAGSKHNAEQRAARRNRPAHTHGVNGYRSFGCRCEVCRAAWSKHNAELRAARHSASAVGEGT